MGKAGKKKRGNLEGAGVEHPIPEEKGDSAILSGRRGLVVSLLLIAATAILIYSNTFSSPFHLDDRDNIIYNYQIRYLSNLWPPSGTRYIGYLSFALNYYFGGLNVFGYHLVNTAIHIINGFLVWWLVMLTFETPGMKTGGNSHRVKGLIALTAALIFVSHPIQTQAVTYIVQRFASLATLFYLLSLTLFIKGRLSLITHNSRLKTVLYIAAALISAILAMKTKEISFTLPFVILLYEVMFLRSFRIILLTPFLIPLLVIPLSIIGADKPLGDIIGDIDEFARETEEIPRGTYLLTQFRVIVTYIRLLILPLDQNLDYDYLLSRYFFEPVGFFCFIFLLAIFCLAIYLYIRSRKGNNGYALLVSSGILWFFITLSVESSIIPIRDVIFEHRLYLPAVGAVIAFSAAIFYLLHGVSSRVTPILAASLVLFITVIPLGIATYNRNQVWSSEITLWEDVVKKSPRKGRGYFGLGVAYYEMGQVNEAIEEFKKAIELKPGYSKAHYNLGIAYYNKGLIDKAIEGYRRALELNPGFLEAHHNLGVAYFNKGLIDEAIEEYRRALELKPDSPEPILGLGVSYYEKGQVNEAIEEFKKVLGLKPDYPEAHYRLGLAFYKQGRMDEAIEEYRKALYLKPDHPKSHYFIAAIYYRQGRLEDAVGEYKKALELKPDLPRIKEIEEALRRNPPNSR